MLKQVLYPFLFLVLIAMSSCQDVIDLDIENEVRAVSIVGAVTDIKGTTAEVRLTAGYFDQGETPPVTGAVVVVFENGQARDTLSPQVDFPGHYISGFSGSVGNQYHIEVTVPADFGVATRWISSPITLSRTLTVDSLHIGYLDRTSTPQVYTPGAYALMYFEEPAGRGDHYRVRRWINDTLITNEILVLDDESIDGFRFGSELPPFNVYGPFSDTGQTARVEVRSISAEHFEYLTLLSEQVYQVGSPFDPPPSPIVGNIYNAAKPQEFGYGFFDASAIEQKSVTFKP